MKVLRDIYGEKKEGKKEMKRAAIVSKITTVFVLVAMLLTTIGKVDAKADTNYLQRINPTGRFDIHVEPGEFRHFVIPVKYADGTFAINSLRAFSNNESLQISNVKITNPKRADEPGYECEHLVDRSEVYNLEFDVASATDLKIGYNSITVCGNIDIYFDNENLPDATLITLTTYTAKELKPIEIVVDKVVYDEKDVFPGNSFTMKLKLMNTGEVQAINTFLNMNFGNSGLIPNYTIENISVGVINPGDTKTIEVPVTVTKTATPGFYDISANISCKDFNGKEAGPFNRTMYITVVKPDSNAIKNVDPVLSLSTSDNFITLKPDTDDALSITIKNVGEATATDVKITVDEGLDSLKGLTKAYTTESIEVGEIKAGKEKTIEIPIHVTSNISSELIELKISASLKDTLGNECTPVTMTMYVKGENKVKDPSKSGVSIGNVAQSPANPKAGEKVTVSFDVINEGTADIYNVKVAGTGLSSSSFEPVSSEPYKKVGTVKAGSKSRVSMTFKVGKDISSGFNTLNISCEYTDANGVTDTESAGLYILNVENENSGENGAQKTSRPKLIISQYTAEPILDDYDSDGWDDGSDFSDYDGTDDFGDFEGDGDFYNDGGFIGDGDYAEPATDGDMHIFSDYSESQPKSNELKAGKEFDFKYTLKNTHTSKAAKNIKITVEQAEGVFIPVAGSNIFYIESIAAGESNEQVIRMKTRSDVATGDYNISIKVEYEYDDMSEVDRERGGVVDENNIKLRAVENYRPEIENIYIDAYEGISVGVPVDLSFEFYNMGKSTLGNVYITIEGDFELANNSTKSYVGAVGGYSQEYVNPQIVALVPGEAYGTIVVHFEDSNGDEQIKTAEFSAYVMGGDMDWSEYDPNFGNMSGGYYNPYFPDNDGEWNPDDFENGNEEGTKILGLPIWLFITICSAVVVIVVVVIIVVVKKKHKKAFLDEDDE
ncbi:MAG: hypothetical protein IK007_10005 [Lachnospiraceae bacterium]|nr:hypothetical protein [Lachnospiraceae bacterium]